MGGFNFFFSVIILLQVCQRRIVAEIAPSVQCFTTKGSFELEIYKHWSPLGAERFLELVRNGFFTDIAFFRCVDAFLTQFGISDKSYMQYWHTRTINDDPGIGIKIKKYSISFAGSSNNSRSTQVFIAFEDLDFLGNNPWETPFGNGTLALLCVVTLSIYNPLSSLERLSNINACIHTIPRDCS